MDYIFIYLHTIYMEYIFTYMDYIYALYGIYGLYGLYIYIYINVHICTIYI